MSKKTHEHWASTIGFIMASAGSAVGLGSLWRFPFMAGDNGGGAFVLLYLIFTFFIGLPMFIGEITMGRLTGKSSVLAFANLSKNSSNWRLVGWLSIATTSLILSYYALISGWCLSYVFMSLNQFTQGLSADAIKNVFEVLVKSPGINVFWLFFFILINVGILVSGVRKGIEHWSKILMPGLFIFMLALFVYSLTLPGFMKSVHFIFYPDFAKITTSTILSALGMAFFTMSVGLGINVTYGSYMQKHENIPSNCGIITSMTVFVSLLAALIIFPIVFTFNFPPQGGAGLIFQALPVLFEQLPATLLISTIFFALVLFAALTSTIALFEVIVANLMELFNMSRLTATIGSAMGVFILGVPSALSGSGALFPEWKSIYGKNFIDTLDYITASWMLPIAALAMTIFLGWRISKQEIKHEMVEGSKAQWLSSPWFFMVRYIAPLATILIILQEAGLFKLF